MEWRWRIPRKTDDKGWKELEAKVSRDAAAWLPKRQQWAAKIVAKYDKQIASTEKQVDSVRKATQFKKLKSERKHFQAAHPTVPHSSLYPTAETGGVPAEL